MSRSRRIFLQQYADNGFKIPENWSKEALNIVECRRLARNSQMARYAADFPRRLGTEASGYELAADKKLSKRIAYVYFSLWHRFVMAPHAPLPRDECPDELLPPLNWRALYVSAAADDNIKQLGATVVWDDWWSDLRPRLVARRMVIASFALARDEAAWGYRYVNSLGDEITWLDEKFGTYQATLDRIRVR